MDGWDGMGQDPSGLGYGSGLDGTAPAAMGQDPSGLGYGAMDGWGYAGQNQTAMDVDYSAYENTYSAHALGMALSTQQLGPNPASLSTQQMHHNVRVGYQQAPHALDVIEQGNIAQKALVTELDDEGWAAPTHDFDIATAVNVDDLGSTTPAPQDTFDADLANTTGATTAATPAQIEAARQAHRAIEARHWGKTALDAKTAWGVLDSQLKETKTINFLGFEMQVPKMSKYAKEKALVAFRDKYGKQIEAYNQHYNYQAKQSKQEPGLFNPVAMIAGLLNPLLGIGVRINQKYGYNESDLEKAITAAEIDAGIKEQEHGEDIDQASCEAMGYRWDAGLQACFKSDGTLFQGNWSPGSDALSSGGGTNDQKKKMLYNVHTGQYDIPPT